MFKGIKMFTIISLRIYDYEQDAVCSFYKIVSTVLFKTIDNLKTVIRVTSIFSGRVLRGR